MRILVADDETALLRSLERSLRFEGYDVIVAADGAEALSAVSSARPDIVVLDIMMPELDGLSVCREMRAAGDGTPVLLLTARDEVHDRVNGLDAGADDYLTKPFAYQELLARLRALARRNAGGRSAAPLAVGPLRIDPGRWEASVDGEPLTLTRLEFLLLETLLRHTGQVLSRTQLYDAAWDGHLDERSNSVEVYIGYLRRKLGVHGRADLIQTVRGVGYVLREPR